MAGIGGPAVLGSTPVAAFPTLTRGWLVGGGLGRVIYATQDGGQSWGQQYP
jgi:hypothetical protein